MAESKVNILGLSDGFHSLATKIELEAIVVEQFENYHGKGRRPHSGTGGRHIRIFLALFRYVAGPQSLADPEQRKAIERIANRLITDDNVLGQQGFTYWRRAYPLEETCYLIYQDTLELRNRVAGAEQTGLMLLSPELRRMVFQYYLDSMKVDDEAFLATRHFMFLNVTHDTNSAQAEVSWKESGTDLHVELDLMNHVLRPRMACRAASDRMRRPTTLNVVSKTIREESLPLLYERISFQLTLSLPGYSGWSIEHDGFQTLSSAFDIDHLRHFELRIAYVGPATALRAVLDILRWGENLTSLKISLSYPASSDDGTFGFQGCFHQGFGKYLINALVDVWSQIKFQGRVEIGTSPLPDVDEEDCVLFPCTEQIQEAENRRLAALR